MGLIGRAGLLSACCLTLLTTYAVAQNAGWQPTKTVEIVIPAAPGGGEDTIGRTVQTVLQQLHLTDQSLIVSNKPGGSGTVAIAYIDQREPDGHRILVQSPPLLTNTLTGNATLGLSDITPVAILVREEIMISVAADSPFKTGADLAKRLHDDPGSISVGISSSPGGHSHAAIGLLTKAAGGDPRKLKAVFFNSGAEVTTAVLGGHIMVGVSPASSILGSKQAGKIRVLGIPAPARLGGALADVPTWREQGVDVVFSAWRALVGPKGMNPAALAWWDGTLAKVTASPEWAQAAEHNLWTTSLKPSGEAALYLAAEQKRLETALTDIGFTKSSAVRPETP